jgi:predicted ABC-type ATPase
MPDPVLHLLVGPNGAGKSTLYAEVIGPATHLEFVNADIIGKERWPDEPFDHSEEAAAIATERRRELIAQRQSFVTETVFSHRSRLELVSIAVAAGYLVTMHVVMVTDDLAVARVGSRYSVGGHPVPEDKVRARFERLWPLVADALTVVDTGFVCDNSQGRTPLKLVATFQRGTLVGEAHWPAWTPRPLLAVG